MQRLRTANGDLQRSCLEASRQLEESRRLHAKVSADELGVCLQLSNTFIVNCRLWNWRATSARLAPSGAPS